jgi:two-component system alkaline phosphatase synthesis response regulator PhoP
MRLKKILVMGDEEDSLTYFSAFFANEGFFVISASNKEDGVQKALEEKPDIITLDFALPCESCVNTLRQLQNYKETKDIPIIIITSPQTNYKHYGTKYKGIHIPEDYFERPINRDLLLNRVKKLLKM